MSFSPSEHGDFVPLFTHTEELDSPRDTQSEASVRSLASSPCLQSRSVVLVSPRPSLSSWPSFSSTYSVSTNCSSTSSASDKLKRVYKSRLTPDDFILHAFGSTSRKSREHEHTLSPKSSNNLNLQESRNQSKLSSRSNSQSCAHSSSLEKQYALPAPPLPGMFITTKPPKIKKSERHPPLPNAAFPVSETDPFSGDSILPQEERSWTDVGRNKREPLMTEEQWREKAKKRAESRKQRRMAAQQGKHEPSSPIPIDIDWRPMEGSLGLPDAIPVVTNVWAARKRASSHKARDVGHSNAKAHSHDADHLHASKTGSSNSIENLDDLAARCATGNLSSSC